MSLLKLPLSVLVKNVLNKDVHDKDAGVRLCKEQMHLLRVLVDEPLAADLVECSGHI